MAPKQRAHRRLVACILNPVVVLLLEKGGKGDRIRRGIEICQMCGAATARPLQACWRLQCPCVPGGGQPPSSAQPHLERLQTLKIGKSSSEKDSLRELRVLPVVANADSASTSKYICIVSHKGRTATSSAVEHHSSKCVLQPSNPGLDRNP